MVDFYSQEAESIFSCGLLLSPEQESSAISLSQAIASQNDVLFLLSKERRPPFIRLYEFLLPERNVQKAFEAAEWIEKALIPFQVEWGEIEETNHFAAIWVKINEPLFRLQRAVLITLNPLREGFIKAKYLSEKSQNLLSSEEKQSVWTWGSPWAEPYIPHMIIAKAKNTFLKLDNMEWDYKSCQTRGLIYGTKEEDGEFLNFRR